MHYLEEMEHYDKDNRYMGASDLCNLICSDGASFDIEKEKKWIAAFIKQLDDKSAEVQGKAVQWLAKIASKIKEDNLGNILKKVTDCIVHGEKDFRDIYCICCKSIMAEITDTYAATVIKSIYPIMYEGIRSDDEEIKEEWVELASEMIKRFTTIIIKDSNLIKDKALLKELFKILENSWPFTLKKKVAYCIGCLSVILSSPKMADMMENLILAINGNIENHEFLFYYILSLSWVSRRVGYKLGEYLESLIVNLVSVWDTLDDSNSSDAHNEIAEEALNCLESLIKNCPKEISNYIDKLLEVAQDRMTYDPLYDYEGDNDMDVDDEEGEGWDEEFDDDEDVQDDDSSWKVRRGSITLIMSVITTRPEMLRTLYSKMSKKLVSRFKERESKIKSLVFDAFSILLKTTNIQNSFDNESLTDYTASVPEMMKQRSSTEELFTQVPLIVKSLLKEANTKNVTVKTSLLECLSQMTIALRDQLNPFFLDIMPIIKNGVIDETNIAIIIPSLSSLKTMIQYSKGHSDFVSNTNEISEIIMVALKNESFSVKGEALLATSAFTAILKLNVAAFSDSIAKLNEIVLSCMESSENAIFAVSHILSNCHDALSKKEIETSISILIEKLKNDLKRVFALRALNRVVISSCGLNLYIDSIVTEVTPLLQKSDNAVKVNTLEVLNNFILRYGKGVKSYVDNILSGTLNIINYENLQVAEYALQLLTKLTAFKLSGDDIDKTIEKVVSLTESSYLSDSCIQKILGFFSGLAKNNGSLDFQEIIKSLEKTITTSRTIPARCIAEILAVHTSLSSKFTKKYFNGLSDKDDSKVIISSLVLGEIGRLNDLSKIKNLTVSINELFTHKNNDVKTAASHCLGHICIANLNYFLPIVIDSINSSDAGHKYLFLIAIREIIDTKLQQIEDSFDVLSDILFTNAGSSEEKIRNVVSECLGKLFAVCGLEMISQYEDQLKSTDQLARSTIARSFKYAAIKKVDPIAMAQLIQEIIDMAVDSEHIIRQFILESLISIVHHLPDLVKKDIDTLFKIIASQIEVKKELIKEVDLGPFKHKIDDGRPIRKAGFVLLDTIFEKMPERVNIPIIIDIILIGLTDPDDDCISQTLHILMKLVKWAPGAVVGQISNILERMPKILKAPPKGSTKISLRIAISAISKINEIPEMETNTDYQKFMEIHNIQFEE